MSYNLRRPRQYWYHLDTRKPNKTWTQWTTVDRIGHELSNGNWYTDDRFGRWRLRNGANKHICTMFGISRTTLWRIVRKLTRTARSVFNCWTTPWSPTIPVYPIRRPAPKPLPPHHNPLVESLGHVVAGDVKFANLADHVRDSLGDMLTKLGVTDFTNSMQLTIALEHFEHNT